MASQSSYYSDLRTVWINQPIKQPINQHSINVLHPNWWRNGVMAMQALPPAEARVIPTPAKAYERVNT